MRLLLALLLLAGVPAAAQTVHTEGAPLPAAPRFSSGATGVTVTLPVGWDGPVEVEEARLPGYAHYAFSNEAAGHPLYGAVVRVERLFALSPHHMQRWQTGAVPYGYHGLRPVGPLALPVAGLGLEVRGGGRGGAVAFVRRGAAHWAVHVSAPEAVWETHRDRLLPLVAAVVLP